MSASETVAVVCPPWCVVPREQHVADLHELEGHAAHLSALRGGDGWTVGHSACWNADGTMPERGLERGTVNFGTAVTSGEVSLDEAEAFAQAILAAVTEMRASMK